MSVLSLAAASLALAGCQQEAAAPEADGAAAEVAGPEAKPGVTISDAKLVLPVVAGRPGAVYFNVTNDSDAQVAIAGVYVEGAETAEMHETTGGSMQKVEKATLDAGVSFAFAPGGHHVMAFDLDEGLKAGGTTEMTITFADGDKASIPLAIEARGEATGGMDHEGMDH
ncbi:MAG: copper chaperone PCu(A)C [Sphingomonadaceae bacterium]